jgi:hypothetical protein
MWVVEACVWVASVHMRVIELWWWSCKTSSKSKSWFCKTFSSFFSDETSFWSSFLGQFIVLGPHQSFHQISSIKPCLVIGFLHHPKNLYIAPKSPPLQALNDLSVHFDLYVVFVKQHYNCCKYYSRFVTWTWIVETYCEKT